MTVSEYTNVRWCAWCVADSGRTNATAPCCIARRVSKMVPHIRLRTLNDMVASRGAAIGLEFRTAVLRAIAMRAAKMVKDVRLELYRRLMRDGWLADDLDAVKRMAMEEFMKGQANA